MLKLPCHFGDTTSRVPGPLALTVFPHLLKWWSLSLSGKNCVADGAMDPSISFLCILTSCGFCKVSTYVKILWWGVRATCICGLVRQRWVHDVTSHRELATFSSPQDVHSTVAPGHAGRCCGYRHYSWLALLAASFSWKPAEHLQYYESVSSRRRNLSSQTQITSSKSSVWSEET